MNDSDGVRTIEQGAPPARFARGWHCLGLAAHVAAVPVEDVQLSR